MTPHFQVFVLEEAGGTKLYCHTFLFGKEFDFEFNLKSKFDIGLPKIYPCCDMKPPAFMPGMNRA
jgi:hypothetical protein